MQPATTTSPVPLSALVARIVRQMSGSHVLGWADQAVVSATSFLMVVMIGRWTDPRQLGAYAIGLSVLALLNATQESLIVRPYSIQLHRPTNLLKEYAFGTLGFSVLFSVSIAFVMGVAALLFSTFATDSDLIGVGWALTGIVPLVMMREFARRFAFAHLVVVRALLLDCVIATLMLFSLALLASFSLLSAVSALVAMGLVSGVGALGWLYLSRHEFSWTFQQVTPAFRRSWQMGKWFLSSQLAMQAQSYMIPWIALFIAGAATTGVYAACTSVVALANPLLYGFFNVLLPKFVGTFREQGITALRRQARFDAIFLSAIMGTFSFVVYVCGDDIMHLLYHSESYMGYGHVLFVLSIAALAAAAGAPASIALSATEHARSVAYVTALTAVLSLVLIAALLPGWGVLGAAYGALAAEIIGSIGRWVAFMLGVPNVTAARAKA